MSYQQLWAPWRLSYIKNDKDEQPPGCFLCRYRDEANDAENYVVLRGAHTLVVLNRFPYNNGHLLVAPSAHLADLAELSDDQLLECQHQIRRMIDVLTARLAAQGFNVGLNLGQVAGAGLPGHLHWHIVPRWSGDTNFMSVVDDVTVIPQSLQALYQILQDELNAGKKE